MSEKKRITILSPQGMLGYSYPLDSLENGLAYNPDVIAVDAGSTDGGPHRLGLGIGGVSRYATKKDLIPLVVAAKKRQIPLIIGSSGGSGRNSRVDWLKEIIDEIATKEQLSLKVACIYSDIEKKWLKGKLKENKVVPCGPVPSLTTDIIDNSIVIVAQMGVEPIIEALKAKPDIIIAGRAYDPVLFAALPIMKGFDPGLALHLGKVLECGAIAASPGTAKDGMIGILYEDHFLVTPTNKKRACTPQSVAAHTLYEKSHPYYLPGPGGMLDLSKTSFTKEDERTVCVRGSRFVPSEQYTVKVEGVKATGYRTVFIAGARDPLFIAQYDAIIEETKREIEQYFPALKEQKATLFIKTYGLDGVLGSREFDRTVPKEIGIVAEVTAETQELADSIMAYFRSVLMHFDYPNRISTSGNLALPFSPPEFSGGKTFEFSIYHLITLDEKETMFPISSERIGIDEKTEIE